MQELQGENQGQQLNFTSKTKTMAGLKGVRTAFPQRCSLKEGCVCVFAHKINYLELIVQVETQRQPYKDSLSFSDSEIAERKTDQS